MTNLGPDTSPPSAAAVALRDRLAPLMRSFRMHRPRSGFCHAGWCQQCRVALSDGRVVLACRTNAQSAEPARTSRFLGRALGRIAAHLPPWFYEHRFLRPKALRQFYLGQLRRFSGAPAFPALPVEAPASYRELECETLVVGGGVSGLAAGSALAAQGRRVVLVEAEQFGGRSLWHPDSQQDIKRAIEGAHASGVTLLPSCLCVGFYENPRRALCTVDDGAIVVRFTDVVVATGAYDRLPAFPGNDLPGIVGGRAFERLAFTHAVPHGARVGLWGDVDGIAAAQASARDAGIEIAWVAGGTGNGSGPKRHFAGAVVERAVGRIRLKSVELSGAGRVPCELLVVAFTQPTYELQTQLGLQPALVGDPPVLRFASSAAEGVLVVGEATGDCRASDVERATREDVQAWCRSPGAVRTPALPGACTSQPVTDDTLVCLCEDVRAADIRAAVADGYRDIELVKRHTGAGTGPCQGKLCHAELLRCAELAGIEARLPTARPLVRPVCLHSFAGKR